MLNLYVAFFATTWGPIVWVLLGEMFPQQDPCRGHVGRCGCQLGCQLHRVGVVPQPREHRPRCGVRLVHVGCAGLDLHVWKFVKETKGVQLEDMESLEGVQLAK